MINLEREILSSEVEDMVLSDGNLRALNFIVRAHGDKWWDDRYRHYNIMSNESRLMFVVQGEIKYEIFGKKNTADKNRMLLIPERQRFSLWVSRESYVHIQYCNFNAVLENESVLDYLDGEWVAETDNAGETLKRFNRFHRTDKNNLMLDCLEKRCSLIALLTEFVRNSGLKTTETKTREGDLLNGIERFIKRYDGPQSGLTIERLAKMANMHPHYFIAAFKNRFGVTPMQYAADIKLEKAKEYLLGSDISIGEIAELLSFSDAKYFSKFFKRRTGMTPTEYRKRTKTADGE